MAREVNFDILLGEAYYNMGFFNVKVAHADAFGRDGEQIEIRLGGNGTPIFGHINRTANPNGTPRIMGGIELKHWIQNNYSKDDSFSVEVLSPVCIKLG